MPYVKKCHNDFRGLICGVCWRKEKQMRKIHENSLSLIQEFVFPGYCLKNETLPHSICTSCLKRLNEIKENPSSTENKLPKNDFSSIVEKKNIQTRTAISCECTFCYIGRLNKNEYSLYIKKLGIEKGRPKSHEECYIPEKMSICDFCFAPIGKGKPHPCKDSNIQNNVIKLFESHKIDKKEQITSKLLKDVLSNSETENKNERVLLKTGGKPLQVNIGNFSTDKNSQLFSLSDMTNLQSNRNLSDRDIISVGKFIRTVAGRSSIESNLKEHLQARNSNLNEMFYLKDMDLKKKNKNKEDKSNDQNDCDIKRPGIFVKDISEFIQFIQSERNLDPEHTVIQFGFDDGQGMLKLMVTIKDDEFDSSKSKRFKYSEGTNGISSKLSSVNRLFIVGLIPNVTEFYPNIKAVLKEVNLEGFEFGFSADLKMYLDLVGKQCASSKHPCMYCEGEAPFEETYPDLTIQKLESYNRKYVENGSKKKNSKLYQNVINQPLLNGKPSQKVIELLNPPELHCLTGVVGKLMFAIEMFGFLEKDDGQECVNNFLLQENIKKCVYQGSQSYEGNQARKILDKIESLENLLNLQDQEKLNIEFVFKSIDCLKLFRKVVISCFGQLIEGNFEMYIEEFGKSYRSLGISVTLKVHIVERHIVPFLKMKGNVRGLGFWSEQAMEAAHSKFRKEWENTKVHENHSNFGEKLFKTVLRFNGKNL